MHWSSNQVVTRNGVREVRVGSTRRWKGFEVAVISSEQIEYSGRVFGAAYKFQSGQFQNEKGMFDVVVKYEPWSFRSRQFWEFFGHNAYVVMTKETGFGNLWRGGEFIVEVGKIEACKRDRSWVFTTCGINGLVIKQLPVDSRLTVFAEFIAIMCKNFPGRM